MSEESKTPAVGTVNWMDLTVKDAVKVKDFYQDVAGWKSSGLDMGGYEDFVMTPAGGESPAGGICHARGNNAEQPGGWMIYITVDDLDRRLERVTALGGKLRSQVRSAGGMGRYCIIEDPSGATCALFEHTKKG